MHLYVRISSFTHFSRCQLLLPDFVVTLHSTKYSEYKGQVTLV